MPDLAAPGLEIRDLAVAFGGLHVVDGVDLDVPLGRITGLIGPNGAGKTTTFNACSGLVRPSRGEVRLLGRDVTGAAPQHRAQLGLGRTFQRMQLVESLSAAENVAIGVEARAAGRHPWHHLVETRRDAHRIADATDAALDLCGLRGVARRPVATLSTGSRRLVEVARVVAAGFRVLLLDEPSSGLDSSETTALGRVLEDLVHDRGVAILLVEHDMDLVMEVCRHLYVLDAGRLVFDGAPAAAQRSEAVQTAYLGVQP